MGNIRIGLAVFVAMALLVDTADAQRRPTGGKSAQKKLYRWVDEEGKVHISDQLPPEAVDQARKEINLGTGATRTVERALTPEERAREKALQEEAAKAAAAAEMLKRIEAGMLTNYQTEDELKRAFEERINLVSQNAEATEISIRSQKVTLASLLGDAAENELAGRPIKPNRAQVIRKMHDEIINLQALQVRQSVARAAVDQEFERVLARYRQLKGIAPPAAAEAPEAAAAPAATTEKK